MWFHFQKNHTKNIFVNPPCYLNSPSSLRSPFALNPPCVPPPLMVAYNPLGVFSQISIGFEVVDVHQNGIWFKLIDVDK